MMCSKALNPNAEPFFLNKIQNYVCKIPPFYPHLPPLERRYYPLPPFACINFHQPRILVCPWQQPNHPTPTKTVSLKQAMGEAAAIATNRVARKSAKGKRKPFERLEGGHHGLASCGVPKVVPKKKKVQAKNWITASYHPVKRNKVGCRGGGVGDVIPFPSNLDVQTTTIMIKNIPNQLQRADLLSFLSEHCCEENTKACLDADPTKSEFDFVYLPMDFDEYRYNKKIANLGYAFANFTSTGAALTFYKKFNEKRWEGVNQNNKTRQITCAKLQGLEALRGNFEKKTFRCHTDEYLPAILEPPCDGGAGQFTLITVGKRVWLENFGSPTMTRGSGLR